MRPKKGDRVGAILGAQAAVKRVELLGFGVYVGDEVPPGGGGWMAEMLHAANLKNPRIDLDSGETVWGCQCWWGSEHEARRRLERWQADGWEVRTVTMADALARGGEA